ncbi:MAG TPA: hypothetical protein PKU97_13580, partial [Kofleriaceae bacterium]|nr:hypothetical protein [Kofleriaceae bacterium]
IEKTGLAEAISLRERLLAEVAAKDAEASVLERRMLAEARGLTEKAVAMRSLEGEARAHEEFRLKLENDRAIAFEQIKAKVQMTSDQSKVMAEAMGRADIKIVGGDGQFFDRFVKAVSLGTAIDGVVDSSHVVQTLGAQLGSSEGVEALLSKLMSDEGLRGKVTALLDRARTGARKLGQKSDASDSES